MMKKCEILQELPKYNMKWLYLGGTFRASLVAQTVKNPLALWEPWVQSLGREDPLEKEGNPLQYSCLENPMDRGSWWATVHGVTKSQTRLRD